MKLYLAHPIVIREEVRQWELGFEARTGLELLNPFYDGNKARKDIQKIDKGLQGVYDKTLDDEQVVLGDLENMKQCDGVLAILPKGVFTIGTIFEICIAKREMRLPIYVIVDQSYKDHPWLKFHGCITFTDKESFEKYIKPLKIAFIGRMGDGKTTAATYLMNHYHFSKFALADKLKEIARDLFNMQGKDRLLLQKLGTDAIRNVFPDAWVNYLVREIDDSRPFRVVVDDVRFLNEAEILRNKGFILVRVERTTAREAVGINDINTTQHSSETELSQIIPDVTIKAKDLSELKIGLRLMMERLLA